MTTPFFDEEDTLNHMYNAARWLMKEIKNELLSRREHRVTIEHNLNMLVYELMIPEGTPHDPSSLASLQGDPESGWEPPAEADYDYPPGIEYSLSTELQEALAILRTIPGGSGYKVRRARIEASDRIRMLIREIEGYRCMVNNRWTIPPQEKVESEYARIINLPPQS